MPVVSLQCELQMVASFFNIVPITGNTLEPTQNKVFHAVGEELWWLLATPLPNCCFHLRVTTVMLALKVTLKFGEEPKVTGRKIRTMGRMRQNGREPKVLQCFPSFVPCVRTSIVVVHNCLFTFASALQAGPQPL